jgi:hypothetical protein
LPQHFTLDESIAIATHAELLEGTLRELSQETKCLRIESLERWRIEWRWRGRILVDARRDPREIAYRR